MAKIFACAHLFGTDHDLGVDHLTLRGGGGGGCGRIG